MEELLQKLESSFDVYSASVSQPEELYAPIFYTWRCGGKRLRPLLALSAYSFYGNAYESVIPLATALEVFHGFTLLHDDIMDNSPIRRGEPTVQAQYGTSQAILSGDAMFAIAMSKLTESPEDKVPLLLKDFAKMALDIMEGQQYDMNFEARSKISLEEYFEMIRLKTAVFFATALKLGAYIGGASEQDCQVLYRSGMRMGIAFQLQDDYLDTYGDVSSLGKPIGGDIVSNKKTWLNIMASEYADRHHDSEFSKALRIDDPKEKILAVRAYYDKCHLPQRGRQYIEKYTDMALQDLAEVRVRYPEKRSNLELLYRKLAGRIV